MNVVARGPQAVEAMRSQSISTAQIDLRAEDDPGALIEALGPGPFGLVLLFISPSGDFERFSAAVTEAMPGTPVVSCTTAGEIGASGYQQNQIVAVGLPASRFSAQCEVLPHLSELDMKDAAERVAQSRVRHAHAYPEMEGAFAFLLVDGLSLHEDVLVAAISRALGGTPLFGGSAADGTRFGTTKVALGADVQSDAAVVCLVRTTDRTKVFTLDHLRPGAQRMVVTSADPAQRIVKTINAEPAAREYARIVGKDPNQLSTFTFAENPVVVRIGGAHHVRAIQQVNAAGELVFFSAIDEGMVLTVAEAMDLTQHLDRELSALAEDEAPEAIIGCDCILRRIEADQSQASARVSEVLRRHKVVGFNTYGEQFGPLHVNQTMTGVALYPSKTR